MKKSKKTVYAYTHTHWDREWYREFEQFRLRLVEVFDDVLNKLKHNDIDCFYFDGQTAALEDYLEIRSEVASYVKELIQNKKLYIGPYYCSTDSFLVDAESLIRNLQMGINYSKSFGCSDFIAYHADTFGHSKYITSVIKYFDIPYAVFWRGLGELNSEFLFNDVKSEYLIEGYFHDYFSAQVSYEKKAQMLKRTLDRIARYSAKDILLPLGADHLAVADNIKEQIKEVNKLLDDYEIVLSTPFEYFNKVKNCFKKTVNSEFRDTKRNFILPGVYSSRIDLKQQNCKLQWQLSKIVQPLQSIFSFLNISSNFQPNVDYFYKELIKNHAHDSIYGCSIDNVHNANIQRFESVSEGTDAILNSLRRDCFVVNSLSVVNLSDFSFNGALKIRTLNKLNKAYNAQLISKTKGFPLTRMYRINEIPVTEDYTYIYEYLVDLNKIDPFAIKNIFYSDINNKSNLTVSDKSIENDKIGLFIKNDKILVKDKLSKVEYKDFLKFIDRADVGDSYNFGALKNDKPIYSKIIKSKIKEKGHIRSILNITFEIYIPQKSDMNARSNSLKRHLLDVDVILENQNDYLEFKINWENKSTDHILQLEFNMENPVFETVSDDLAGYIKRAFEPDYDVYKYIPAPRGVELRHNTAPIQKCLLAQGVGIVTEGLQEYEVFKNKLRLTVLRATGTISNPYNPTRGTPAGPPLPTPDLQMLKKNTARFAISFKNSIKKLEPIVQKFYASACLFEANLADIKLFSVDNSNVLLSTIKTDKKGNLILRFLNKSDKEQLFEFKTDLKYKQIFYTDAMENPVSIYSAKKIAPNSFVALLLKK